MILTKKEKKNKIAKVVKLLKGIYPEAKCSLEYEGDGWKLMVMGRLSAQCTDERVNIVCRDLFKAYPTAKDLADAPIEDIEAIIKPCGLYKMKAKSIKEESRKLHYEYNGIVPSDMKRSLPLRVLEEKLQTCSLAIYTKSLLSLPIHTVCVSRVDLVCILRDKRTH